MDVTYVDEHDKVIGTGPIAKAYENSIIVRVVRIFISNSRGELLLQKRSSESESLPGVWDHAAAGHVDAGEDYDHAAARELHEEMGISGIDLKLVASYYGEEHDEAIVKRRFNKIYSGVFDGQVNIDNNEVTDYKWVSQAELEAEIRTVPGSFTDGFLAAYEHYKNEAAGKTNLSV